MGSRYVSIWFRHLATDWFTLRQPALKNVPFVLSTPSQGRMVITAANAEALKQGVFTGMVVADARAIIPSLHVRDDIPGLREKLLKKIGAWCIRFTPIVALDLPDGLIFDASGCSHLWGGDRNYVTEMIKRFSAKGYKVRIAMADTVGAAWATAHFGGRSVIIESGKSIESLLLLPPEALRIDAEIVERLHKLGLGSIGDFIAMPRSALRRRFGQDFVRRLQQAMGSEEEIIEPIIPVTTYQERLPCLEPIQTATGIEIALEKLTNDLCSRLQKEGKGLRKAAFKGYRIDGKVEQIEINTNHPSNNAGHLLKLFGLKICTIEPALGIEFFTLEAPDVEDCSIVQEQLWHKGHGVEDRPVAELLDRLAGRIGSYNIHRYLPAEHHWPEHSIKEANSLTESPAIPWNESLPRPVQLLSTPEKIEVTAPIPDYPPMLFRYKGKLHKVKRADGPERIEQEWWLKQGEHRDYYYLEDEDGQRYWVFRAGHYTGDHSPQWFIHGFFA